MLRPRVKIRRTISSALSCKVLPGLLLVLRPRQPLHVARIIPAALAQGDDVIYLAAFAAWGLRMGPLEIFDCLRIAFDAPVAIPWATFTLDRVSTVRRSTPMASPCRIGGTTAGVSPDVTTASPCDYVRRSQRNQCERKSGGKSKPNRSGSHGTLTF